MRMGQGSQSKGSSGLRPRTQRGVTSVVVAQPELVRVCPLLPCRGPRWGVRSLGSALFVCLLLFLSLERHHHRHDTIYMLASGFMVARAERSPVFPSPPPTGRAQDMATAPSASSRWSPGSHTLLVPFLLSMLLPDPSSRHSRAASAPGPDLSVAEMGTWTQPAHGVSSYTLSPGSSSRLHATWPQPRASIYQAPSRCRALL